VPDREGWYPVGPEQSVEQMTAYFAECYGERRARIVEEFERTVAELRSGVGWGEVPEREKYCRILESMGYGSKAARGRDCHDMGIPGECVGCGLKYFRRYRCTLRFCPHCGDWHFARLMDRYAEPIADVVCSQGGWGRTLAMLTFTIRADGGMPHPDKARWLMKCVRRWFKRIVPQGETWGAIFAIETGYELPLKHPGRKAAGWNLHCHALYFGPYLDFGSKGEKGGRAGEKWRELTNEEGQVIGIKECEGWRRDPRTAVRKALAHHFGYILKPAAESGERLAALEVLFGGVRRVHGVGVFYRLPKPSKKMGPCCPQCRAVLPVNLRAWHRRERFSLTWLESEGRRDLAELRRERGLVRALGGTGG
jgi:hypothetical protein